MKKAVGRPRVVLADDHPGILEEVRNLLAREFEIVGAASEGRTLLSLVAEFRPDVVVSDINMPLINGIDAGQKMLQQGICPAVILLTVYNEPRLVDRALQSGIRGYVLKEDAGEELALAVSTVAGGGAYLSSGVRRSRS